MAAVLQHHIIINEDGCKLMSLHELKDTCNVTVIDSRIHHSTSRSRLPTSDANKYFGRIETHLRTFDVNRCKM